MSAETDIRELLQLATPVPLVFADENGPRPAKPYATVAMRWAQRSRDNVLGPLEDPGFPELGTRTIASHREVSIEVHGYGDGIFEALDLFSQMLDTEQNVAEQVARNIAFWQIGQVTRLPTLRDASTYEPHAIIEINGRYVLTVTETVGIIEHVEGSIDTVGGLKDDELPPFEFTIDIPPA